MDGHMRPTERRRPAGQAGFTYLWVLLLIAFMGVGLTVAVEVDSTAARRDREKELLAIGRQFQVALARYHEAGMPMAAGMPAAPGLPAAAGPDGAPVAPGVTGLAGAGREYPASLDDLLQDRRAPGIRRHLRKVFVDPMTGKAEWGLVLVGGRIVGVHSLSDAVPIKQDGFDPDQAQLRAKQKYSEWLFTNPYDGLSMAAPAPIKEDPT